MNQYKIDKTGITTIVFPATSNASIGYPLKDAVLIAIDTFIDVTLRTQQAEKLVGWYSKVEFPRNKTHFVQQLQS